MTHALEEIRRVEREVAQLLTAAEERAAESIRAARLEADQLMEEARTRGLDSAKQLHADAIAGAVEGAARLEREGDEIASQLAAETGGELEPVVDALLGLVLAPPAEAGV